MKMKGIELLDTPKWQKKAAGVWSTQIGREGELSLLNLIGSEPLYESLERIGEPEFPLNDCEIKLEKDSRRYILSLPLDPKEKIYGLGLQFKKINHRGRVRFLRVNSDPKEDTGETHAPVPFYVSSRGYGLLVDTARIVTIYCGADVRKDSARPPVSRDRNTDKQWVATPLSDRLEVVVPSEGFSVYIFAGKTMLEVVQRYNLYCGGGVLPPKWGLGFWCRVHKLYGEQDVLDEARQIRRRGYPCDVIGLEPGWHTASYPCTFEWNNKLFPDPKRFCSEMKKEGFRVNIWEHPYVSPRSTLYKKLEPYSGNYTVWTGLAPDFTMPEVQDIFKRQHAVEHLDAGISGYKLDECDGSELTKNSWMFPPHARFPSGHDGEEMRQVYGLLLQKITADLFRQRNQRTYGLVRASNAGASSLPYVLYSDLYDHRDYVRALCNSGFSGLLWTPEVRSAKTPEEWVRRIQVVCFSPLAMLNAWSSNFKLWTFTEVEDIVRKYLKLRMQLMPYYYTAFARYRFEGIPPFRSIQLEMENRITEEAKEKGDYVETDYGRVYNHDIEYEYMAGDSMLVAPIFAGETSREVFLPEGDWYDFETGEHFKGGGKIVVSPGLEKIPVFVKDGSIIPMMPPLASAPAPGEKIPLEVRHYGRKPAIYRLYDDDGETFDYEKGEFCWITLRVEVGPDGIRKGFADTGMTDKTGGGLWEPSFGEIEWKFMG